MGKASLAGRFKIGTRISTGFVLILALLGLVVALGISGMKTALSAFNQYSLEADSTVRISTVERNVVGLRRNVTQFGLTGDDSVIPRIRDLQQSLRADLADLAKDGDIAEAVKKMSDLLEAYSSSLEVAIQARHERDRIVNEQTNVIGNKVTTALELVMNTALEESDAQTGMMTGIAQNHLAVARMHVLRYQAYNRPEDLEGADKRLTIFRKTLENLIPEVRNADSRNQLQETLKLAPQYQDAARRLGEATREYNRLLNELLPAQAAEFTQMAGAAKDTQNSVQRRLQDETRDDLDEAVVQSLTIGIGAGAIGLVLAWLIARSITRPVRDMTDTMSRLAGGELEVTIPALANRDEIGEMAQAVQVFKDNAVEKKRMDAAEQARLEAERRAAEDQRARELAIGREIAALIDAVSKGDLSTRIDLAGKDGFYRTMSEGINRLTDTVAEVIDELAGVLGALAGGDLSRRIARDFQGAFERLKSDVNATSVKLAEIVGQIHGATEAISAAAGQVSAGSSDLAERTEQQASSLEETAASMEELSATVRSNADNAQRANHVAAEARSAAEAGGTVAGSAIEAMQRIEGASRKIIDIIGVIDEIAFQTNLLALNAAVEAARAGDAGKGFAVVAQEVRVLAQRSAQASKEIKSLILDSDAQVKDGVDLVKRAGGALGGIVDGVKQVASLMAEIAAASNEQASGLDEINATVAAMDEMTQKNAALVEETTAAAQSMATQAAELRHLVAFFKMDRATAQLAAAAGHHAEPAHAQHHHAAPAAHGHHGAPAAPKPAAHKPAAHKPAAKPHHPPAPKPATHPAAHPASAPAPAKPAGGKAGVLKRAAEAEDDDWKEF